MTAMKKSPQNVSIHLRVSKQFKAGVERAAQKAGDASASEFLKQGAIARGKKFGEKIER